MKPYYQDSHVTIYHGDCRDALPNIHPCDLVLTDPPYGIRKSDWDVAVPLWVLPLLCKTMNTGASLYWFGLPPAIHAVAAYPNLLFLRELYWWYQTGYPCQRNYRMSTETIVFMASGRPKVFNGDAIREPYASRPERPNGRPERQHPNGKWPGNVIVWPRPAPNHADWTPHPTTKPASMLERFVLASSEPGGSILDPFMGCGSTLVAAKRNCRMAVGIDLSEEYCEYAAKACCAIKTIT
jgi:DNA modification methylase